MFNVFPSLNLYKKSPMEKDGPGEMATFSITCYCSSSQGGSSHSSPELPDMQFNNLTSLKVPSRVDIQQYTIKTPAKLAKQHLN